MRGILFLIASVICFGIVDGLSKMLIETQSFGQVVLARYALALPVLLAATHPGKWKSLFQTKMMGWQIVRGLIPAVIGGSMILAVKYLPLAEATVILFAGPFLVLALSGWLLGEKVSAASWIGVAVGFAAVLIVARPGFSALSQYTIFPIIAAVFYAGFQLLTRWLGTSGEAPTTTLAWTLAVGAVIGLPLGDCKLGAAIAGNLAPEHRPGGGFRICAALDGESLRAGTCEPADAVQLLPDFVGGGLRLSGFPRHSGYLDT